MNEQPSRIEFLQTLGRGGLMLGIAGVGVSALHGSKSPEECMSANMCGTCHSFGGCTLPEKKEDAQ